MIEVAVGLILVAVGIWLIRAARRSQRAPARLVRACGALVLVAVGGFGLLCQIAYYGYTAGVGRYGTAYAEAINFAFLLELEGGDETRALRRRYLFFPPINQFGPCAFSEQQPIASYRELPCKLVEAEYSWKYCPGYYLHRRCTSVSSTPAILGNPDTLRILERAIADPCQGLPLPERIRIVEAELQAELEQSDKGRFDALYWGHAGYSRLRYAADELGCGSYPAKQKMDVIVADRAARPAVLKEYFRGPQDLDWRLYLFEVP